MYLRRQRARTELRPDRDGKKRFRIGRWHCGRQEEEGAELHQTTKRMNCTSQHLEGRTNEGAFLKLLEIVADSDDLIKSHRAPVFTYILAERDPPLVEKMH